VLRTLGRGILQQPSQPVEVGQASSQLVKPVPELCNATPGAVCACKLSNYVTLFGLGEISEEEIEAWTTSCQPVARATKEPPPPVVKLLPYTWSSILFIIARFFHRQDGSHDCPLMLWA
jgi:hypothetical protein